MQSPKVFISYSHDSVEHKRAVFRLSESLRFRGVDCTIDQYELSPPEGWAAWSLYRLEEADFVLVVCTETYERRFGLKEEFGRGAGAKWEGAVITRQLFEAEGRRNKFIPVVFAPEDVKHIPLILRLSTWHVLSSPDGFVSLYRRITGQPETVKGPLGEREILPPIDPGQIFPSNSGGSQPDAATLTAAPAYAVMPGLAGESLAAAGKGFPAAAINEVPSPVDDFVGREDITERLHAAAEKHGRVLLHGMGGIGKTELALLLAQRLSAKWPAQLYFDLKGNEPEPNRPPVADMMYRVIRQFEPSYERPQSDDELRGHYHSVLHKNPALLLLDNAADRRQVEPFARLPKSCMLLITSRQRIVLPGLVREHLPLLSDEDASKLLLKIAPRIGPDAPAIARRCGHIPLALRLAAAALAEQDTLRAADYVERLEKAKGRLRLMEASIQVSYNLLGPEQQKLWRMLSVFPETFDRAAAAAVWCKDVEAAQDVLSADLEPRSLIVWDNSTDRFRLHDLLRIFADDCLTPEERDEAARRHAFHYRETLAKGRGAAIERLELFDIEQANIKAGFSWAATRVEEAEQAAKLCSDYVLEGRDVLRFRLKPGEMLEWALTAKQAARRLNDLAAESRHTGIEGLALADLGNLKDSVERYKRQLKIAREINDLES